MEKALWRFAVLGLLAATACAGDTNSGSAAVAGDPVNSRPALVMTAAQAPTQPLFLIERSKNANVVHYDAQFNADGKLDSKAPVVAYWIMLAEDGRREDLNWVERKKAYGFDIKPDASGAGYQMTVVSAPKRPITVKKEGGVFRAELVIDGHLALLEKMYINSTDGMIGPKVHYIELRGKDVKTGEKRVEKIVPD
jgi:hypothetical protein